MLYRSAKRVGRGVYLGVSRLGETIGCDALTYNYGVFRSFHRLALWNAAHFVDVMLSEFPGTKRIADIGCGSGGYAAEFKRRNIDAIACEYSARGRRWAERQGVPVVPFDLGKPTRPLPGGPVDLAYSIEVAEHVPPSVADAFVAFVARAGDTLAVTAAQPGQGGQGHVNEQPLDYWIGKIALE